MEPGMELELALELELELVLVLVLAPVLELVQVPEPALVWRKRQR